MQAQEQALVKQFFQSLEDRPLEPNEPIYEARLHTHGTVSDPVAALVRKVDWSDSATVNLVSGQRGAGKSTEMRRLRRRLEEADCVVFLLDINDYINLSQPLDITDFLVVLMGALGEQLKEKYGKTFNKDTYWERFKKFFDKEVELQAGFKLGADIKASLKSDTSFRRKIQQHLQNHLGPLVRDVQAFATEAVAFIHEQTQTTDTKVVLLVDSLERIRGVGEFAEQVHKSVENLFNVQAHHLHLGPLHTVYTVPPYLPPLAPVLSRHLGGGTIWNLANAHIFKRAGDTDPKGLEIMRGLVTKRFAQWPKILSEEQLNRVIISTGGDLRDCFRLLKQILVTTPGSLEQLPVTDELVEHAENEIRRDMLPIAEEDRVWLESIHKTGKPGLAKTEGLYRLAHFFDTNLVQCYRNGEDWYDVHPLLRKEILTEGG